MKRCILLALLFIVLLYGNSTNVLAYYPHALPEGRNYLSQDNFETVDDYYQTIEPFLVIPNTEYLLTIPCSYKMSRNPETLVTFFMDSEEIDSLSYDGFNYVTYSGFMVDYVTFTTPEDCNYLALEFLDGEGFFIETTNQSGIMLEEGVVYSGYEMYLPGTIVDTDAPYFQSAGTVISYVDTPISVAEIQSGLIAYDAIDGDVSESIVLKTDNYTAYCDTLGTYSLVFSVADTSLNEKEITIQVSVVDVVKPMFSPIDTVIAVYPNAYSEADLLAMMQASDNYDGSLTSEIQIMTNGYQANSQVLGTYPVEFSVTDSSGNQAFYTMDIRVVDEEAPILSGTETIVVGYDQCLTPAGVKETLCVIDNYDAVSDLSIELVEDTYSLHHRSLGEYQMVFQSTDSSGNTSTKTVLIEVVDQIPPVVYYDFAVIQTYTDRVLTIQEITTLLTHSKEIDQNKTYQVVVEYDSYSRHMTTPGTYHLSLTYEDESGVVTIKELQVVVKEKPETSIVSPELETVPDRLPFFQNVRNLVIGGLVLLLAATNILWVFLLKKRKI